MPDSSGKIRGITVPSVPWHELSLECIDNGGHFWPADAPEDRSVPCTCCGFDPGWKGRGDDLTLVDSAIRDADQMLWDKQTDEGPSALEKLRDKS